MRACGPVERALDSEGLGFDSQCWPYVEVSGKPWSTWCTDPRLDQKLQAALEPTWCLLQVHQI